jgi:tRNA threonylcarbamoyladenosine biosynthesis protein TsaB
VKLLALDTATEACSVALYIDGTVLEKYELAPRRHAELILPMIDALLAEAQIKLGSLDALAFGRGPGAFTGVRIATGVIQGLAFATGLPVVPVSTLAALAQGAISESDTIVSVIDARMNEVYWGMFSVAEDGTVKPATEEQVCKPELVTIQTEHNCYGVGSGWDAYTDILSTNIGAGLQGYDSNCFPRASNILTLARKEFESGKHVSAAEALPVYLRNKVTG